MASALQFVLQDLKLAKFSDVDANVEFIRIVDRLFDLLNSKNPFAKEFKSVLRTRNESLWRPFLHDAIDFLLGLYLNGQPLHQSMRKTAVLGFVVTAKSIMGLFDDFVKTGTLSYLATYRLSQDHIELTFNVVRCRGRWNNNPTAGQFRAAYRLLLVKHTLCPSGNGNSVAQQEVCMLPVVAVVQAREPACSTAEILSRYRLCDDVIASDHSYAVVCDKIFLSEFSSSVVMYIAGRVSQKLSVRLSCGTCREALLSPSKVVQNSKLLQRKDAGGLVYPSESVTVVCRLTEQTIRFICSGTHAISRQRHLLLALQMHVVEKSRNRNVFTFTDEHSCATDVFDCPRLNLIRLVVNSYCNIRMHAVAKSFTEQLRGLNVRSKSNKQVLFLHQ